MQHPRHISIIGFPHDMFRSDFLNSDQTTEQFFHVQFIVDEADELSLAHAQRLSLQYPQPNTDITQKEINEIEKKHKQKNKSITKMTCAICMENIKKNALIWNLNCGHKFHSKCIRNSAKKCSKKCPICRTCMVPSKSKNKD